MADGTRMQQRRDTEANWVTSNYVLAAGEIGFSTDTNTVKLGNGSTHWVDLPVLFETEFLARHGKADDSFLLNGVDGSNYITIYNGDTAATADKFVIRTATGTAKAATAVASDDLVQKAQLDANALRQVSRTVTAAATLALTDQSCMLLVNQASLTTQVVVTVPPNSGTGSVAFPIGAVIEIIATGAGGAKLAPGTGVTLTGSTHAFPGYGGVRLIKTGTNTWMGISLNAFKRLPKVRVLNAGGNTYPAGSSYTIIPWGSVATDSTTYNPDNDWFDTTHLAAGRRIVMVTDGEYEIECNFIQSNVNQGSLVIAKMTADNSQTGATWLTNASAFANTNAKVRSRFSAGESVGAWYQAPSGGSTDFADGTSNNRCDFKIARLSD
jgi:hypothetical protein